MSEREYRAAIIGLGFVGGGTQISGSHAGRDARTADETHFRALTRHPRVRLVAGCDLDPGRRERFGKQTSARNYADWRKMLDIEGVDVVSIATPAANHAELTVACAERKVKAVYCDTPIASTAQEGDEMIRACENSSTLLVVNYNCRFDPKHRHLRSIIAAGDLGELTSVYLRWGGGCIAAAGTPLIDAARMLTGREVTAISGTLDDKDRADSHSEETGDPGGWGVFHMEGGLKGLINAGNRAAGPAELILEGTLGKAAAGRGSVRLEWFDGRSQVWPTGENRVTSMDRAVGEIVGWLDEPDRFSSPAVDALGTFEVVAAMHLSHAGGGGWVGLPLTGTSRQLQVKSA